jgi:nitrite reductase (NO-forming)
VSATTARRGFQPLRDLPVLVWLALLVVTAAVHPWVPAPRWLLLHLLLLGAVSHAVHVWSQHFADALLHSSPTPGHLRARTLRLALHDGGAVVVITGVLAGAWPVTLLGAASVAAAAGWHAGSLAGQARRALSSRFAATVHYYVVAACLLPVGATLGVLLAAGLPDPAHLRVLLAHVLVNLLGWVGLTVLGTLLTLWPTMLRTRLAEGAERAAARALPVLGSGLAVAALGALGGVGALVAAGVAAYLAGVGLLAPPFVDAARRRPPRSFATMSVLAGVGWFVLLLAGLLAGLVADVVAGEGTAGDLVGRGAPLLAAGFAAQVLLGALSYLVPVALRGGPAAVRAATTVLDRGSALRVAATNAGLAVLALPAPSLVRVLASTVVLAALAAFLPLLVLALRASRRLRARGTAAHPERPAGLGDGRPSGQLRGLAAAGLACVVLAVAAGVALDPLALAGAGAGRAAAAGVEPTGETTTVRVEARDMRFHPGRIEVPAGDRLVVEVVNTDDGDVHDLVLDSGERTGRLAPGESATLEVGVVGRDLEGWCSVAGHRQMGMVLEVDVTGEPPTTQPRATGAETEAGSGHHHATTAPGPDPAVGPGQRFEAADAVLPPLGDATVHRVTLTVREVEREVAPGVTQTRWTYDGTAPGPVLHGRVGDRFVVRLVNDGSIGHSVDFHAGALAPDRPMRTIPPGESLVYRFTATRAGIWMYHCSTMPMSAHIANGMYGAVVIEPPGLPPVDRSYLLVQSELYLGTDGSAADLDALAAERPDAVVFNGYADQYAHDPLPARTGERVRVWVLDAGPNRSTSFHVVGGQFDVVYAEGAYLLGPGAGPGGAQSLALAAAQGGFVELTFPEAGSYPFVSHVMVDAERGARGVFEVSGP